MTMPNLFAKKPQIDVEFISRTLTKELSALNNHALYNCLTSAPMEQISVIA